MSSRNKYFMLFFLGFFLSTLLFGVFSSEYSIALKDRLILLIPGLFGVVLMIWSGYKYLYLFFGRGTYLEFLHGIVKSRSIFEEGGVKFSLMLKDKILVPQNNYCFALLVENAHDTAREFYVEIKIIKRLGKTRPEQFVFTSALALDLEDGEFGLLKVPVHVSADADHGSYSVELITGSSCNKQGRRARTRFGRQQSSPNPAQALLWVFLALIPFGGFLYRGRKIACRFQVKGIESLDQESAFAAMSQKESGSTDLEPEYSQLWLPGDPFEHSATVDEVWVYIESEVAAG